MQEEPDEDSQCLSDDTDIEISTQVCVHLFSICPIPLLPLTLRRFPSLRMHGSVRSAGSTTPLSRGTAFAAGLFGRTGTRTSLGSPIPSLFPTSQHAVLSLPTMTRTTAMPASTSPTAPGPCLTPSSCPLTPQPIDRCPARCQERVKLPGLPASTKMSRSPKGIVRKV